MYLRPDLMDQLVVTFIMVQLVVLSEASMGRQVPDSGGIGGFAKSEPSSSSSSALPSLLAIHI